MLEVEQLDSRLQQDCHVLGWLDESVLLLNKNALYPWFIVVPDTNETEFYKLSGSVQGYLLACINNLSEFINSNYDIDKLNVATIGNVVEQMHIHIIGRSEKDPCWPGVVWGADSYSDYQQDKVEEIKIRLKDELSDLYNPLI